MKYSKVNRVVIVLVLVMLLSFASSRLILAQGPTLGGCSIFPNDNIWNTPIDTLPVDPNSNAYINMIGPATHPHADFGSGDWPLGSGDKIGIPYVVVPSNQPLVAINISPYASESDPGPYPVPPDAPIEAGSDSHVLVLRQGECKLYEMFAASPNGDGSWDAQSGAIFDLNSNDLRQAGWTSADAAGLPILPGLTRFEEVNTGEINHALRFTAPQTRNAYVWPARHEASDSSDPNRPPMGQYFRLKSSFVVDNTFSPQGQVILRALKKYGMILADNGSAWYISGAPDEGWNNGDLADDFNRVSGSDFEAVDISSLMVDPDSAQAIAANEFALSVTPSTQTIDPGDTTTYDVIVTAGSNFTETVTVMATSPSPSQTLSLVPTMLTPEGQATLTLTDTHPAGLLLPGLWYTVPVTATGGGLTQTATVSLLVGGTRSYLPVILKGS